MEIQKYFVGIDPQPTQLAVKVEVSGDSVATIDWFNILLKLKSLFKTAEEWELYVADQCNMVIDNIVKTISVYSGRSTKKWVYCAIEQQRGRVKSIIEACLVAATLKVGWIVCVPHPVTWKKSCKMKHGKGNTQNKIESEKMYSEELELYCAEKHILVPKRIHDLCDAAGLCDHLKLLYK